MGNRADKKRQFFKAKGSERHRGIHGGAEEKSSCESGWTIKNGSDDSMTSDASSWPSTQLPRNTKNHAEAKNSNAKKVNHQTKNRASEKSSNQEEESEFKARTRTTAASRVRSRDKDYVFLLKANPVPNKY
ncbi:hypothetical protein HID58_072380 [Brassica napus]|uniref:Uncharacterized protein n=1 Tax=Brassica napus TaxID=3708 RepID=A0ABQ7Z4F3_BRANA|nr:hypothetical protein HID58_072380 [Brassica napus]